MSNALHYDLERRVIETIWTADEKLLRTALVEFVRVGSVAVVSDVATLLGVSHHHPKIDMHPVRSTGDGCLEI